MQSRFDVALTQLLRDHGFRIINGMIWTIGVRGFTSPRMICRCRDVHDACELLFSIAGPEFHRQYDRIVTDSPLLHPSRK